MGEVKMRYAQIFNGTAHWIFDAPTMPEFASNIVLVDVTNVVPSPQEGWLYDGVSFIAPLPPPLRPLPPVDFLRLFTAAEFEAIDTAAKTNAKASAFLRWLQFVPQVSSADPRITVAMNALAAAGILTPARRDAILGSFG